MKLLIRKMRLDDTKVVHEIEMDLFSDPWSEEAFVSTSYNYNSFVMIDADSKNIVGYLIGEKVLDEFMIYNLGIRKQYQGFGHGIYLTKKIIDIFIKKGCKKFVLEVRMHNIAAISMYRKLGFSDIYIRKNYYKNPPDDAIVMIMEYDKEKQEC